jgi:hypothetical protein
MACLRCYKDCCDNLIRKLAMKIARATVAALATTLCMTAPGFPAAQSPQTTGAHMNPTKTEAAGLDDFDFLVGRWRVHHRQLKERLANSHEWIEFEGTSEMQKIMGGYGTFDDNVLEPPAGAYRAAGLRSFEPKSGTWSIWWLDSRTPLGPLDPPVRGSFHGGVGTFLGDDTFKGIPIRVRYTWSKITPTSCHWEQAFSTDGGISWETNWLMDLERAR